MVGYDKKELEIVGEYRMPGIYGSAESVTPRYNYPITPRENMIRMLEGQIPLWLPNQTLDNNAIQPLVMPDARARNFGGTDWFGIESEYEPLSQAAMVKPGTRRLSDITKWQEEIIWPDLSAIDWKKDYEENYKDRIGQDRFSYFVIINGLFERTADLMGFEDAFCALLEEPEELTAFYDRLVDWHIELIKIARDIYHADMILFHDDMGTQINTFFSPDIFEGFEELGDIIDYKIKLEVVDKEKIAKREIEDVLIEDFYVNEIYAKNASAMYILEVEMTLEMGEYSEDDTEEIPVAKINGKWVIPESFGYVF